MSLFEGTTLDDIWRDAARYVREHGDHIAPRGIDTRETVGAQLVLHDTDHNVPTLRPINYKFMLAEFLWIVTGQNRADMISHFNSQIQRFSDDGVHMSGAYGPPVSDQLPWAIGQLKSDDASRQAVISIWRPRPGPSRDVPCTVAMQFMLRRNRLHMITTMRSNDLWLGFPHDVFVFTMIQRLVASALDVKAGTYFHNVGSLHLYERNVDDVSALRSYTSKYDPLFPVWPVPLAAIEALIRAPMMPLTLQGTDSRWRSILRILYAPEESPLAGLIATNNLEPKWSAE